MFPGVRFLLDRGWAVRTGTSFPGRNEVRRNRRPGPRVELLEDRSLLSVATISGHVAPLHHLRGGVTAQEFVPIQNPWSTDVSQGLVKVTAAQGLTVQAPAGFWFQHEFAGFQTTSAPGTPLPSPLYFKAWIFWGDGTRTSGYAVGTGDPNTFLVTSSHRYRHSGTYQTTIQILAWPQGTLLAQTQGLVVAR